MKVLSLGTVVRPIPWTTVGVARLQRERDAAAESNRDDFKKHRDNEGKGSVSDDLHGERVRDAQVLHPVADRLGQMENLLKMVQEASPPSQTEQVRLGNLVRILYLTPSRRKDAGEDEEVILGGLLESHSDAVGTQGKPVLTINTLAPLGKALAGGSVGQIKEITTVDPETKQSFTYEIEILEISIPPNQQTLNQAAVA